MLLTRYSQNMRACRQYSASASTSDVSPSRKLPRNGLCALLQKGYSTAVIRFLLARQRREGCLDQHFPEICQWIWSGLQSTPFPRRLGPDGKDGRGEGGGIQHLSAIQDRSAPAKTMTLDILRKQGRHPFDTLLPNRHERNQA